MKDFFLYAQFAMLLTNIVVFIFVMQEHSKYKLVKVCLLFAISLGTLVNLGKLTWLNVLFAFTPFVLLGKIFKHDNNKEAKIV